MIKERVLLEPHGNERPGEVKIDERSVCSMTLGDDEQVGDLSIDERSALCL